MMFTIVGYRAGKRYTFSMKNGTLRGDEAIVDIVRTEAGKPHGVLGLPPNAYDDDYLQSEPSAFQLVELCFDSIESATDDWEPQNAPLIVY